MEITFNITQLIEKPTVKGKQFISPTKTSFFELATSFDFTEKDSFYEIKVEKEENYIWFEFDYGQPSPIADNLTNVKTGQKKENPRKQEEAELISQFFVLYDYQTSFLYLSNRKKNNTFVNCLEQELNKKFHVKEIFKTKEEFINILKNVSEISFTEVKNLFNNDSKKRQALIDIMGTDAPEKFKLIAEYKKETKIKEFINKLIDSKARFELEELVIKGVDNNDFEILYNIDSFIKKISIQVEKNDRGIFNPAKIKEQLLKNLL